MKTAILVPLLALVLEVLPVVVYSKQVSTTLLDRVLRPYDFHDWHNNRARLVVVREHTDALERIDLTGVILQSQNDDTIPSNYTNTTTELSLVDLIVLYETTDDWPRLGIGANMVKHYQDHTVYCCTAKVAKTRLCQDVGALIVNHDRFQGIHIQVAIPAQSTFQIPLRVFIEVDRPAMNQSLAQTANQIIPPSNVTENETSTPVFHLGVDNEKGSFVVAMANCNPQGRTVQVQGVIQWKRTVQHSPSRFAPVLVLAVLVFMAAFVRWNATHDYKYYTSAIANNGVELAPRHDEKQNSDELSSSAGLDERELT